MLVIPAIDLKDGEVVRLTRGDFKRETIYSNDPASVARDFVAQGAERIHVVDLEGALCGELKNLDFLRKIVQAVKVPVEFGGGVRSPEDIKKIFDLGVSFVVLGTKAIEDQDFLKECIFKYGNRIIVSLDSRQNMIMKQGWSTPSGTSLFTPLRNTNLLEVFENLGLEVLIYTDISRDGTLEGPNFEGIKNILKLTKIPIIASGGISSLEDLKRLKELESQGLAGVIVGKAIYEGKINLREAIQLC